MIKVLHVIESLDPGGAERVVLEHAAHHDSSRFRMEVCCVVGRGPLADAVEACGVPVHLLSRKGKFDLRAAFRLASLFSRGRFHVMHNHNFTALSVGVPAAVLAGAKAVVRTEHNVLANGDSHRRFFSRAAALRESAQIAVADAVRASHVAARRIPAARFVTIRNGIGDARFGDEERAGTSRADVLRELGVPEGDFVCLSVGSLTDQKNHANLIRAAALVPRGLAATFLIVGDGPLRGDLERAIREAGLEGRVRLLGRRLDVPRLLAAADLFVLSSDWEGLPITLLEAMAARVACLSTRAGGTSEVIRDGVDGFLVPPRDPGALAAAIERLARGAPGSRTRAAAEGRRTYEARFTGAQMARQTEALYELALCGRADLATAGRIKVLYVIGQLGYGGAERQLLELASRLPRDRFEPIVCVLSDRGPLGRELEAAGVSVVCLNKRRGVLSAATGGLIGLVRRERPAIIHSYLFSGNWRGLVAGRLMRVPVIVSSVRNVDIHSRLWLNVLERMFACFIDRVIANAEAVKDYVARKHWVPPQRIHVIHNGVAVERFAGLCGGAPGTPARTGRTVAMLASLTPKKDPFTFLEAAALVRQRVPDARFLVIGDGPLRGALEARARALGLDAAVRFLGETADAPGVLAGADVSVLTSIKEGCSNVVLESMAAGCPMVATAVGGNPELIEDGVTGYLVPAGDAAATADRIARILTDPGLAARMGEAARAHVVSEFSVERMVEKTVGVYAALLAERVPGLVEWAAATAAREGGALP